MTAELLPKPQPEPPEYVSAQTFDAFRQEIRTELSNLRQQLTTHETRLTAAQDKQTGDIMQITAMMQHEQSERKQDIANLRADFGNMLEQLKAISTGMTSLSTSIAGLQGTMHNWQSVMEAQTREHDKLSEQLADHGRKFETVNRDIDLLMSSGAANTSAIDSVKGALYGDPTKPDAPDSLYKLVGNLSAQVKAGTDEHNKLILSLMTQGQGTIARLDTIESWQKAQAEKWARRKQVAKDVLTKALTSKPIIAGIVVTLLALIAGLLPQATTTIDSLIAVFQKALGQ